MFKLHICDVAIICYDANRAICAASGNNEYPIWGQAPEWMRDNFRKFVSGRLNDPVSPEAEHAANFEYLRRNGWRYGPTMNAEIKTHPLCVPYSELPDDEVARQRMLHGLVDSLRPFVPEWDYEGDEAPIDPNKRVPPPPAPWPETRDQLNEWTAKQKADRKAEDERKRAALPENRRTAYKLICVAARELTEGNSEVALDLLRSAVRLVEADT